VSGSSDDVEQYRIEDASFRSRAERLLIRMKDTTREADRMDGGFLRLRIEEEQE